MNGLRYLAVASAITMALIGLMSHNSGYYYWTCLVFHGECSGMPIGDSLASTWQQQIHLDYGKVRLIGSFAFVVGVMVFGYLSGVVGEQYITWMITGILIFYSYCDNYFIPIQCHKMSLKVRLKILLDF